MAADSQIKDDLNIYKSENLRLIFFMIGCQLILKKSD